VPSDGPDHEGAGRRIQGEGHLLQDKRRQRAGACSSLWCAEHPDDPLHSEDRYASSLAGRHHQGSVRTAHRQHHAEEVKDNGSIIKNYCFSLGTIIFLSANLDNHINIPIFVN